MPARPALPLHLSPLSLSSPSSPIFLSLHNWIMGGRGGSIVHCFGFPWFKSSSQSGWEGTGEASRHLWGCEGSCWGSEWAEGTERPPVMGWHEIQHARVHSPLKLRQVVLLEGRSSTISLPFLFVSVCMWVFVCFLCVAGSVFSVHSTPLDQHA